MKKISFTFARCRLFWFVILSNSSSTSHFIFSRGFEEKEFNYKMKLQKWKTVPIDTKGIDAEELEYLGGIEELSDYKITRPDKGTKKGKRKADKKVKQKKKIKLSEPKDALISEHESEDLDMGAWSSYNLQLPILNALADLGFEKPTQIQELTIPSAIRGNQDILGAAETGSGKTLAFGIPIINSIISIKESKTHKLSSSQPKSVPEDMETEDASENEESLSENEDAESEQEDDEDFITEEVKPTKPLYCLVLTPTRELAIQIKNHLIAICKYTDIKISVVVGGMALEKQRRVLRKCPEIVVATPGRLWELIEEGESHISQLSSVRYLVIDEADRMVEKGHFAELTQILSLANGSDKNRKRQTFVFSATLTLIHNLPNRFLLKNKKGKTQQKQKIDSLVRLTGMKDPKVIDITRQTAVVDSLTETQIMCSNEEKDSYLYYFLLMYPGRTIVFCNSIDCVRRLRTVLEYLNCHPLPLHASMQQRQRLKNLEKFEKSPTAVLLATDVAARGLDIKGIEHVIHFQVPRTAETYVHRSGRTARAQKEGLSLVLIEPQDATYYNRICKTLNKENSLPNFPIDYKVLKFVKERVTLVRSIDKLEHRMNRLNAQNRWIKKTAEEMDVDIEDESLLNDLGDAHEVANKSKQINAMKKELKIMLSRPIINQIVSCKYPTKSGKLVGPSIYNPQKAVSVVQKKKTKCK
ncbi:hypothetical protein JTE90_011576 [Oedothorax gibbosus]|uniref:ATP-dependent RNA helicase n=1 Tax=Oedothorax gibbosus TaxID=931172 RepID=A0AAV6TW56_9ARAC|nr:hypothetical protein JTE90_011576 [Oedothorax gibbosus]